MGSLFDDLDSASEGQIRALMGVRTAENVSQVNLSEGGTREIKVCLKRRPKPPLRDFEPEILSINDDITREVTLPGYMWAALDGGDLSIREYVREGLKKDGITWAYPRFLMALEARRVHAKSMFTRMMRLE